MTHAELRQAMLDRADLLDRLRVENQSQAEEQKHRCEWAWGWHDALAHSAFLESKLLREWLVATAGPG